MKIKLLFREKLKNVKLIDHGVQFRLNLLIKVHLKIV